MKLQKSFEQVVCIMAILATQKKDVPVGSSVFPQRLDTSISYTQKLLRKLVVAGLVTSVSGNNGGFSLARSSEDISVLEVVEAIEGGVDTFPDTGLINKVFSGIKSDVVQAGDLFLHQLFQDADEKWRSSLAQQSIGGMIQEIIPGDKCPVINWNDIHPKGKMIFQKMLKGKNAHD